MFKTILFFIFIIPLAVQAQLVSGKVETTQHEPLVGATIRVINTQKGVVTGPDGYFKLRLAPDEKILVVSFVGFENDTITVTGKDLDHIQLIESNSQLEGVIIRARSTFIDALSPIHNEILLETELLKAACCNLSESFETNASVDVSLTDAVSGAKMIRMLGLDGRYVQINRENIPLVRGLSGRYGISFVPGTWIQSIDIGKGAGSVMNGYESMAGQINLEFKKPENSEKLYLNTYANSFGRVELNANSAVNLNERWKTGFLLHTNYLGNEIDNNHDGFMDLPKSKQINLMNRYKYQGEKLVSQIGLHFMQDSKAGGQLGFDFGDDLQTSNEYGFENNTRRLELFGKIGLLFPNRPYKGWGFIYSGSLTDIDGGFGRNIYSGKESTFYTNIIHQNIIGNSFHQFKTGMSLLVDDFKENYSDSTFNRLEIVPGTYFEYSYLPSDKLTVVTGLRLDYHNLYGLYYTPRVHFRYQLLPTTTWRASLGKGYRTPNVITENTQSFISSRILVVEDDPKPEIAWNMGTSLTSEIPITGKPLVLSIEYFYTTFKNRLVADLDQNPQMIHIYNLRGKSFAHSFQVEGNYEVNNFWKVKSAYKFYDVQTTINDQLLQVPLTSRNRFFLNSSYATKFDKWQADATLQWYGRKRLPDTSTKPLEYQNRDYSPDFFIINAQVSRGFKWGNIYLGSENLLNFKQNQPIIDPENPFGDQFDASMVWGPVAGRVIYAGLRYKIKNTNQ